MIGLQKLVLDGDSLPTFELHENVKAPKQARNLHFGPDRGFAPHLDPTFIEEVLEWLFACQPGGEISILAVQTNESQLLLGIEHPCDLSPGQV